MDIEEVQRIKVNGSQQREIVFILALVLTIVIDIGEHASSEPYTQFIQWWRLFGICQNHTRVWTDAERECRKIFSRDKNITKEISSVLPDMSVLIPMVIKAATEESFLSLHPDWAIVPRHETRHISCASVPTHHELRVSAHNGHYSLFVMGPNGERHDLVYIKNSTHSLAGTVAFVMRYQPRTVPQVAPENLPVATDDATAVLDWTTRGSSAMSSGAGADQVTDVLDWISTGSPAMSSESDAAPNERPRREATQKRKRTSEHVVYERRGNKKRKGPPPLEETVTLRRRARAPARARFSSSSRYRNCQILPHLSHLFPRLCHSLPHLVSCEFSFIFS